MKHGLTGEKANSMGKWRWILYKIYRGFGLIKRKYTSFIFRLAVGRSGKDVEIMPEFWIEGGKYISIGNGFAARRGLRIEAWNKYREFVYSPVIHIGDGVRVGEHCHIGAINEVNIGNNVLMGSKVYITDHHHGNTSEVDLLKPPVERRLYSRGKVIIEDNVFIGDNVVIMPGVKVGHNSVIGANAVVTKDVMPFSVIGGVPGKVI